LTFIEYNSRLCILGRIQISVSICLGSVTLLLHCGANPAAGLLGYLNFSDGRPDPRWQRGLNEAFAYFARREEPQPSRALIEWLTALLAKLQSEGTAGFRDVGQGRGVLGDRQRLVNEQQIVAELARDELLHTAGLLDKSLQVFALSPKLVLGCRTEACEELGKAALQLRLGQQFHPAPNRDALLTQQFGVPGLKRAALKRILDREFDVVNFHNLSLVGGLGE